MLTINVERRQGDFMAFMNGDRTRWEAGFSADDAIDKLLVSRTGSPRMWRGDSAMSNVRIIYG